MSRLYRRLLPLLHFIERLALDIAKCVFEALPAGRRVGGGCVGCTASQVQELLFLDDGLHETDTQRRVAAIDVSDVVGVLLIDFVDDESQALAQSVVVCDFAFVGTASDADGDIERVCCRTSNEEAHFLEVVQCEDVLVAVGVENLPFEIVEVLGAEAACDGAFEAEETEDCDQGNVAGDELFDFVVLSCGVDTGDKVLLDLEDAIEGVRLGVFKHLFGEICVGFEALLLSLVAGQLVHELAKLGGSLGSMARLVFTC